MSDDVENQHITIVPTQSRRRARGDTMISLRRTLSIQPPAVQPSARLPIEYRTLSLHLESSKSDNDKASKGTVKGRPVARHPPHSASPPRAPPTHRKR